MRPLDWQQDKGMQEYIGELQLQAEEQLKKLQDQERLSNARLREQDILITELQEKLDATEDELKERKKELGELRSKDARSFHPISLLIVEWQKSFEVWKRKSNVVKLNSLPGGTDTKLSKSPTTNNSVTSCLPSLTF
jgi:hypothetical protein